MALPNLVLYRRANAPAVRIVLEDVVLTGSTINLDVTPKSGGATTTYSTGGGGLTLSGTNTVIWTYSEDDAAGLPVGDWTSFDLYRIVDDTREKIGAGTVRVNGVGGFEQQAPVYVEVPGIQGPAAYLPEGMWEPGPYVAKSVTTHSGSTWLALVDTEEEPGEGSDWQILLDGSGAAADREAAENAAAIAVPAGEAAVSAAEIVVPLAAQVDANATAVETARAEVATNTTTVATNTAAAEAAKVAAEAAELAAQTAVANPSVAYDLLTTLNADLAHAAGTVGQVLAEGTNNGFYVKVGASGTGSWSKKSNATVPALDVRTSELERTIPPAGARKFALTDETGRQFQTFGVDGETDNLLFRVEPAPSSQAASYVVRDEAGRHFFDDAGIQKLLQPPAQDAWDPATILGPDLFVWAGSSVPLYLRNLMRVRSDRSKIRASFAVIPTTTSDAPYVTEADDVLVLEADRIKGACELMVRVADDAVQASARRRLSLTPRIVATGAAQTTPIIAFGDSISNRGVLALVRSKLIARGFNPTWVGTINAAGYGNVASNTSGPLAEAREGWASTDFLYSVIDGDTTGIVAPGGEATYLALTKTARVMVNPFVRIAIGGDNPAYVRNGYIFDYANYISRFSLSTPSIAIIGIGTNDVLESSSAVLVANINIMVQQIWVANSATKIGIWLPTIARSAAVDDAQWASTIAVIEALVAYVRAAADARLKIINVWAHLTQENWPISTGSTDAATGIITADISDAIHPAPVGIHQIAEQLAAYVAWAIVN